MNGKVILSIVAVIVLVHVVVIYLFVRESGPKTPKGAAVPAAAAAAATQGTPATALPGQPQPGQLAGAPGAQRPPVGTQIPGPAPLPPGGHLNPNFGKPFTYTNAIKGNIASIPDSDEIAAGILVDLDTRQVLWAKDAKSALPIASMSKMMTMLIAFEDVLEAKNGLTLDTQIKVTPAATKIGGSQVYLDPKETFTLRELLQAVAIKSANDAAYLVAEHIGNGDVHAFVQRMNARAKALGMNSTVFHNPHGLPEKPSSMDNVSSPEDMAILAEHILEHKQLMEWASTWLTDFRPEGTKGHMQITNHNHLVPGSPEACTGVDGLKTGFINRSGFCITVTCKRGDKRTVAVVMGSPTWKGREIFVKKLLDWGYRRADNPSEPDAAPVTKGAKKAAAGSKEPAKNGGKKPTKKAAVSEEEQTTKKTKAH